MTCTFENCGIVPKVSLPVDVDARTFTCVVVIPSMGAMVGSGVGGGSVNEGRGIGEGGKVAVTKVGVAVLPFPLEMFTPQPVHTIITARSRKICLRITCLL